MTDLLAEPGFASAFHALVSAGTTGLVVDPGDGALIAVTPGTPAEWAAGLTRAPHVLGELRRAADEDVTVEFASPDAEGNTAQWQATARTGEEGRLVVVLRDVTAERRASA